MGESSVGIRVPSRKIGGRLSTGTEGNFRPQLFGEVARVIWPEKTDVQIALIAKCSSRAAREYLNGKVPPPAVVVGAIFSQIVRRW